MTMLLATINNSSSSSNIASTLQQIKQQQQRQKTFANNTSTITNISSTTINNNNNSNNNNNNNNNCHSSSSSSSSSGGHNNSGGNILAATSTQQAVTVMNGSGLLSATTATTIATSTATFATTPAVPNGSFSGYTTAAKPPAIHANPIALGAAGPTAASPSATDHEPEPEIDIVINNVVCSFSVRCHLNLREIALNGFNVEYRRENGMVTMKLRRPYTTASIWSSGRITCTGATSEIQAKIAARRYSRCLEKLGFRVRFQNFRVVNVLGTCSMPWSIKIVNFSEHYKKEASYEPELHPGVTYKLRQPKATLKIFSTGSITVTAASVANVQAAIEHIFPLVYDFRKARTPEEKEILRLKQQNAAAAAAAAAAHHAPRRNVVDTIDIIEVDQTSDEDVVVHSPPPNCPDVDASTTNHFALQLKNARGKRKLEDQDDPLAVDDDDDEVEVIEDSDSMAGFDAELEENDVEEQHEVGEAEEEEEEEEEELDDNIIMCSDFENPEDLIEGPDDEYDDEDL